MPLNDHEQQLIRAYQRYAQAGQRYMAGQTGFRKRVREDALLAELENMQAALKDILRLGANLDGNNQLTIWLPAEGRIGKTKIVDVPHYKILQLPPGSGIKFAAFFRGETSYELIRNFSDCLVPHKVQLKGSAEEGTLRGPAPLFENLICETDDLHKPDSKRPAILFDFSL